MSKDAVSQWDTTAANNTDIGGVDLAENSMRPRDVNNAIRTMMAQVKALTGNLTSVPDTVAAAAGFRNRLINGNGAINQRSATSQADDTYAWDRHYVLTQTGAIGVSTLTDVANGLPSMMRATQSQASAQRMGIAQIIEAANCKDLRGQAVALIGKLRCSSAQAIRYAILEWTGTADSVTSDVVNSWTNATFTAGQFFNSTTLTVTAVGTLTPVANTVTDFLLPATLGSSGNNVIVMIWTEGTAAQNVTLDVAWQFAKGDFTGQTYPIEARSRTEEEILCMRYYEYNFDGYTASVFDSDTTSGVISTASVSFKVAKRGTPTVALSNNYNLQFGSTPGTPTVGRGGFSEQRTATGTASRGYFSSNWTADAEL